MDLHGIHLYMASSLASTLPPCSRPRPLRSERLPEGPLNQGAQGAFTLEREVTRNSQEVTLKGWDRSCRVCVGRSVLGQKQRKMRQVRQAVLKLLIYRSHRSLDVRGDLWRWHGFVEDPFKPQIQPGMC